MTVPDWRASMYYICVPNPPNPEDTDYLAFETQEEQLTALREVGTVEVSFEEVKEALGEDFTIEIIATIPGKLFCVTDYGDLPTDPEGPNFIRYSRHRN